VLEQLARIPRRAPSPSRDQPRSLRAAFDRSDVASTLDSHGGARRRRRRNRVRVAIGSACSSRFIPRRAVAFDAASISAPAMMSGKPGTTGTGPSATPAITKRMPNTVSTPRTHAARGRGGGSKSSRSSVASGSAPATSVSGGEGGAEAACAVSAEQGDAAGAACPAGERSGNWEIDSAMSGPQTNRQIVNPEERRRNDRLRRGRGYIRPTRNRRGPQPTP